MVVPGVVLVVVVVALTLLALLLLLVSVADELDGDASKLAVLPLLPDENCKLVMSDGLMADTDVAGAPLLKLNCRCIVGDLDSFGFTWAACAAANLKNFKSALGESFEKSA